MDCFKTFIIIDILALIMLIVFPIRSMPTNDDLMKLPIHQKRWTFNTWRLHGRRQLSNDFYSPTTSLLPSLDNHQYDIFDDAEDDARKTPEHLSQFFQE
ncbi:unnamed protein product [Rotaria sp. Silwood2]|nr:unnamed protein product [Rotaria sp. Silwood2]CAF4557980.1 unnamed protein product [Rotaria sp. Silwood2]